MARHKDPEPPNEPAPTPRTPIYDSVVRDLGEPPVGGSEDVDETDPKASE